jgi:proprotein convertase subtilisin/kexin type 5
LGDKKCHANCPTNYFNIPSEMRCGKCSLNCSTCSDNLTCTACDATFFLHNTVDNQCYKECPSKFFGNTTNNKCEECSLYCNKCTSSTVCTLCNIPYYLHSPDKKCYDKCPEDYIEDSSTATCKSSWLKCADGDVKKNTCKPGEYKLIRYGSGEGDYFYNMTGNDFECEASEFRTTVDATKKRICETYELIFYWIPCGKVGDNCKFSGNRFVRYGGNGRFLHSRRRNEVACNSEVLGEPDKDFASKECYYSEEFDPSKFTFNECAVQNRECKFKGTQVVRYGWENNWSYYLFTERTSCDDRVFADSLRGRFPKRCEYQSINEDSCPSGQFLKGKQCVKKCIGFTSIDNRICYDKCPEGQVFQTKTTKCQEKCNPNHFLKGQECLPCDAGTFPAVDIKSCVFKCRNNQFLILDTLECYPYCPNNYKILLERDECALVCADYSLLTSADGALCVPKCPEGQVQYGNSCYYDCPIGLVNNGGTCLESCTEGTFLSFDERFCVRECLHPFWRSLSDRKCVWSCPHNTYENSNAGARDCVKSCPDNLLTSFDNSSCLNNCPVGQFTHRIGKRCYSSCPITLNVFENECFDTCPPNTVLAVDGRNCISSCPNGHVLIELPVRRCILDCPFNYIEEKNVCKPIDREKTN